MLRRFAFPLLVTLLAAGSLHCGGDTDDADGGSGGIGGTGGTGASAGAGGNDGGSGGTAPGGSGGSGGSGAVGGTGGDGGTGGVGGTGATGGTGGSTAVKGLDCPGTNAGCQCSDGLDNDGDGLADEFDPECSGPYDNDEATFWTGIPGDNRGSQASTECFFDGNSGPGNDSMCASWTPNGCDCFGCCWIDVNGNGSAELVGMFTEGCRTSRDPDALPGTAGGACRTTGDACDAGLNCLDDGDGATSFCTACGSCVQDEECNNPCLEGEDCVGEPPGGGSGGSGGTGGGGSGGGDNACGDDGTSCTVHADCPGASEYCVTGCCVLFQ